MPYKCASLRAAASAPPQDGDVIKGVAGRKAVVPWRARPEEQWRGLYVFCPFRQLRRGPADAYALARRPEDERHTGFHSELLV